MIEHYFQKIVSAVSKHSANWMGSALSVWNLVEIPKKWRCQWHQWHSLLECMHHHLNDLGIWQCNIATLPFSFNSHFLVSHHNNHQSRHDHHHVRHNHHIQHTLTWIERKSSCGADVMVNEWNSLGVKAVQVAFTYLVNIWMQF